MNLKMGEERSKGRPEKKRAWGQTGSRGRVMVDVTKDKSKRDCCYSVSDTNEAAALRSHPTFSLNMVTVKRRPIEEKGRDLKVTIKTLSTSS